METADTAKMSRNGDISRDSSEPLTSAADRLNPVHKAKRKPRLTDATIARIKRPKTGYVFVWDQEPGLGVRLSAATGGIAFLYDYTMNGRRRRMVLDAKNIAEARLAVATFNPRIAEGEDPLGQRREGAKLGARATVADLVGEYVEQYAAQKRDAGEGDRQMLGQYVLPAIGHLAAVDIKPFHIDRIINEVGAKHPVRANRVRACISAMFNRAIANEGWELERNPVNKSVRKFPEYRRPDRFLSEAEVKALIAALDAHRNQQSANAIRLLLTTGARRGELLSARWSEIDLSLGVWHKPAQATKQAREHHVQLNPAAVSVLQSMQASRRGDSDLLFPGLDRKQPLGDVKKSWKTILQKAGIQNFRLHDLRHNFASVLISNGATLHQVAALLGHSELRTTQRYAHLQPEVLREAAGRFTLPAPAVAK
jgi:integrase